MEQLGSHVSGERIAREILNGTSVCLLVGVVPALLPSTLIPVTDFLKGFPITEIHFCLEHRKAQCPLTVQKAQCPKHAPVLSWSWCWLLQLQPCYAEADLRTLTQTSQQNRARWKPESPTATQVGLGLLDFYRPCTQAGKGHPSSAATFKCYSDEDVMRSCVKNNTTVQQCVALAVSKLLNLLRRFSCVEELLQVSKGEALTFLGGADFPLHLLTLSKCMPICPCTSLYKYYKHLLILLKTKEGCFIKEAQSQPAVWIYRGLYSMCLGPGGSWPPA